MKLMQSIFDKCRGQEGLFELPSDMLHGLDDGQQPQKDHPLL